MDNSATTVVYRHLEPTELTRPPEGLPYRVIAAMIASRKFGRGPRGHLLYSPDGKNWTLLARWQEIVAVLRDEGVVQWAGDAVPDDEWQPIAWSVHDIRLRLPLVPTYITGRDNQRAHNTRHTGYVR